MLERWKKRFCWANYDGMTDIEDDDGNIVETVPQYTEPMSARANISANKGTADAQAFGNLLEYDRTLATRDVSLNINENSILWLDGADPETDPHNYIVVQKAVTNNVLVLALKRVEVG